MNTKFTMLVAAGLLFAGVSQAQGTEATAFNKPRHEVVSNHHPKQVHGKKKQKHRHHKKANHKKVHHRKVNHK